MNHYLLLTTYPVLFVAVFANQLSMPVPGVLFLLAAGALCHMGQLSLPAVLALAIGASLLGDTAWFLIGRKHGGRVLRLLAAFSADPNEQIRKTKRTFEKYGLRCLLVAKFIPGIDAVAPPLAGMSEGSIYRFWAYDSVGAAIWAAAYAGLGLLFSRQLNGIAVEVSRFAGILAAALGIPLAIYMIWHTLKFIPVSRSLHLHRIQPERLWQKISSGDKILIFDLLSYEEGTEGTEGIPTSVRLDPSKVRQAHHVVFPSDLDVVLYCASPNHFRSSRVALELRKHGVQKIEVLAGGLKSWREQGLPLTHELLSSEEAILRYRIQIT
ncbi:VTT domain-containing protein [Granulicella arctica]|uniref:VTT domain-containing protein n=1 Tax=Granulicella arctica TaxID=940613 RepID=UPI0021E0AFD5|nr:VTT domain-containing protein [Granulicella arctica]